MLKIIFKNKKIFKITLATYIIIISYLAFMPVNNIGSDSDKVNHILAFILFTILVYLSSKVNYLAIFVLGVIFGLYIEFVQYFIPYRSSDFMDLIADTVGIVIGISVILFLNKINIKRI